MLTIENGVLVKCDENATEVVIPADITEIESDAFKECKSLKILRFPKEFDFKYLYENPDVYGTNDFNCYWDIDTFFIDSLTDVYYEGSIVEWIESTGYLLFKENVKIHCTDGDVASLAPDMEKIVIPAGVTEIPDYAFFGYSCKEIEIPDSVTDIGEYAFCKTSNLKTITFPAGLKSIGLRAFVESGIETINFKGTIEQWKKVCMDEPWDTSYDIWLMEVGTVHCSDGDTDFDDLLYIRNNCIEEVTYLYDGQYSIPIDIEAISEKAFGRLDNECELNYEGTKEQWFKIDKGVDWDNYCVTVVHCSDGDIQINKGDKELNDKLLDAVNEGNLEEVVKLITAGASVNASNDNKGGNALNLSLYRDFKEIAEFLIKQGAKVNSIYRHIFTSVVERGSCESLKSIVIPKGVTEIDSWAFQNCKSLVSIELPEGVTKIRYDAFSGCVSLKSIVIPKSLKDINSSDLKDCTALSNIKYGGTIEEWNILYSGLFHDGSSEITIECSDGIAVPFSKQENITSIVIPDSVNKISDFAFENCASLTSVTIPETVTEIGKYAFAGCKSLKSIVIPDSVYNIGEGVFKDCEKLSSVTLSKRIDDIPSEAFYNCTSLTTIEMPEHVRFIEEFALCNTSKLKTITLHNRLQSIYNNAFKDSGIENIYYKGSKSDWGWIKIDQPWGIPCKYTDFNVTIHCSDGDIPFVEISSANGVLYGMGSKLIKCDENATDVLIPADIHEFARSAFEGCKSLKTLRFTKDFDFVSLYDEFDPSNDWDDSFDIFVFDSLTDVYYEGTTVEWIDAAGFLFFPKHVKIHCSDGEASPLTPDMEKIVIPAGVTELPNYAFYSYNCKEIELPAGLKYIGDNAFEESGIGTINFKGTKEQWKKISKDQPWGTYRELREWVVSIVHCSDGDAPFFDKDVVIDDNGVVVEPADFFIFDYTIPADVKKIGRYAFDVYVDDPRRDSGSDIELTYEGTIEQWLKIDKGENWYGKKVVVVHCSDGDIQINKGDKELDEKLLDAISEGNFEEVKKLIIAGTSVNASSEWGTALNIALCRDFKEIAEFLLKQGAVVKDSALCDCHNTEIAELLIAHGADINAVSYFEDTALMVAARNNNKEMAEFLIVHGANVNAAISCKRYMRADGQTALMYAAGNNAYEIVKMLLEHGADINAVNAYGKSALSEAVRSKSKELVELLISYGADANTDCVFQEAVKNSEILAILLNNKLDVDKIAKSEEALSAAVDCSNKEAVELLINHGANVKTTALLNCHTIEIAKLLIDHGANINAANESGYTALMVAAEYNRKEIAKFLIEHGANINAKNKEELTALMLATKSKYTLELVELLIANGANINTADKKGISSLMIAASHSSKEVMELLIEHGADVNARNKLGESPLMCCLFSASKAKILIEHGADINTADNNGDTVFSHAVFCYGLNSEIAKLLIQQGVDRDITNKFIEAIENNNTEEVLKFINNGAELNKSFNIPPEFTPLMVAAQYDSKEVAELLIEHGAEVNCCIEVDNDYYYPLSAAAECNAKNVAEVLLNHGAITDTIEEGEGHEFLRPIDYAIKNNSIGFVEVYLNHGYEIDGFNVYVKAHEENSDEDGWEQEYGADPIAYAEEHNFTELAELLKKRLKKS